MGESVAGAAAAKGIVFVPTSGIGTDIGSGSSVGEEAAFSKSCTNHAKQMRG